MAVPGNFGFGGSGGIGNIVARAGSERCFNAAHDDAATEPGADVSGAAVLDLSRNLHCAGTAVEGQRGGGARFGEGSRVSGGLKEQRFSGWQAGNRLTIAGLLRLG